MPYKENPKTCGSGLLTAIPQAGVCPHQCPDCFAYGGRSYLGDDVSRPNMPPFVRADQIVRVNDANDSNNDWNTVVHATSWYPHRFFNTSVPLLDFPAPVVLTLNPGDMTDKSFHQLATVSPQLMFVRFRLNMWNIFLLEQAIQWYCRDVNLELRRCVPLVCTWMCYPDEESIPAEYRYYYSWSTHVSNPYWRVRPENWCSIRDRYRVNKWVYHCGTPWASDCAHCGNCVREWHVTMDRLQLMER